METAIRCWADSSLSEGEGVAAPLVGVGVAASAGGWHNCATVTIKAPLSWTLLAQGATVRLYGKLGQARVLLYACNLVTLAALGGGLSDGTNFSAMAIAVSGYPCSGFEVECQGLVASLPGGLLGATVELVAWGDDAATTFTASGQDPTNAIQVKNTPDAYALSGALEASTQIAVVPVVLYSYGFRIDATAPSGTYYVQLLDASSLPADGAVTRICSIRYVHTIGTDDGPYSFRFGPDGVKANAGLFAVLSTTEFTKTIAGAYLVTYNAQFKKV